MDAPNAQEVTRRLFEQGYDRAQVFPTVAANGTSAAAATAAAQMVNAGAPTSTGPAFGPTAKPEQLGSFFRQLASLIHSGFSVSNAFSDLGMRSANRGLGEAAKSIGAGAAQGQAVAGRWHSLGRCFRRM
jgi:type II secretory pathway component PulF